MSKAWRTAWVWNPFWAGGSPTWMGGPAGTTAGVTYQTATAHPFASTGNERYVKHDGNQNHSNGVSPPTFADDSLGITPDGPHRWAVVYSAILRLSATNPSADTYILYANSGVGSWWITRKSGTATGELFVDSVSQGTFTFPTGADFVLEVWSVRCDQMGIRLTGGVQQFCVRKIENLTTTQDVTVLLDVDVVRSLYGPGPSTGLQVGDSSARGAGYEIYSGNYSARWECADAPCGIIRCDHMWPNSRATVYKDEWTTHAETNVDDTGGNVLPDGVTTVDSVSAGSTPGSPKAQYYDLTAPLYATGNDTVLAVIQQYYGQTGAPTKGTTDTYKIGLGDGTTVREVTDNTFSPGAAFSVSVLLSHRTDPADGLVWSGGDLSGLEVGMSYAYSGSSKQISLSAHTVFVAYVANGEETPAIPRPRPGKVLNATLVGAAAGASRY